MPDCSREVFEQVGGLNETDLTVAFNDVDFCLKVNQAGYVNVWTPYAEAYHLESISRGAEDNPEKIARSEKEIFYMKKEWVLDGDPYYNQFNEKPRRLRYKVILNTGNYKR